MPGDPGGFVGGNHLIGGSPFAAGGGFDVDPATIRAGAAPLDAAAAASRDHGGSVPDHASSAAAEAAGTGRLNEVLQHFGSQAGLASGELDGSLAEGARTLERNAEGYERSDAPLPAP